MSPIPIPPYPQQSPLGRKAKPCLWVFRWARFAASRDFHPFIPITGFISKSRNHPFEQISRIQHHHGKVLFSVPFYLYLRIVHVSRCFSFRSCFVDDATITDFSLFVPEIKLRTAANMQSVFAVLVNIRSNPESGTVINYLPSGEPSESDDSRF